MLEAALWGLVGGLALVLGALIAFIRRPSSRAVAYVMAFGAGVLISAVAYDLTAEAFELGGGDAVAIGLARRGARLRRRSASCSSPATGGGGDGAPARALALGALLDGIPESAAIGLTLIGGGGVSVSFVAAVFLSNLPESISATSEFERGGRSRRWILGVWIAIALASAVAAAARLRGARRRLGGPAGGDQGVRRRRDPDACSRPTMMPEGLRGGRASAGHRPGDRARLRARGRADRDRLTARAPRPRSALASASALSGSSAGSECAARSS